MQIKDSESELKNIVDANHLYKVLKNVDWDNISANDAKLIIVRAIKRTNWSLAVLGWGTPTKNNNNKMTISIRSVDCPTPLTWKNAIGLPTSVLIGDAHWSYEESGPEKILEIVQNDLAGYDVFGLFYKFTKNSKYRMQIQSEQRFCFSYITINKI